MKFHRFALLLLAIIAWSVAAGQPKREIDKSVPLVKDGRVVIDTYKGSVTIETWEKDEVKIHAVIEVDEDLFDDDVRKVEETEIRISAGEREVRIRTDYDKVKEHGFNWLKFGETSTGNLPLVHYTIKMPKSADLHIKDYKSRTVIRDLHATIDLNSYKGEIAVDGLEGGIRLDTYKGEARIGFASLTEGSTFSTYKGTIAITVPQSAAFNLETDFERRVEFDSNLDMAVKARRRERDERDFTGSVNGGGPVVRLKSDKGTFRLNSK